MLSNRITCPRNKRTSGSNRAEHQYIKPIRGCPQGGVGSPMYWNMVINKLITILHGLGIHVVAYADDLALLISGISTMTLCSIMNSTLREVEKWCISTGLTVNLDKSQLMRFTLKKTNIDLSPIKLFGKDLKLAENVKYLGIILDSKLNMKAHIEESIAKE